MNSCREGLHFEGHFGRKNLVKTGREVKYIKPEKQRFFGLFNFFLKNLKKVLTTADKFVKILLADAKETQASIFYDSSFDN